MSLSKPKQALMRLTTAGAVDSGKSTLMGHLLYLSGNIPEDQWQATLSQAPTAQTPHYSSLLDGLAAEQEQGITIDVAYRYFWHKDRAFRVADCPGHVQYTRNMMTGASQADVALIVLDITQGLEPQTRHHMAILTLMDIRHWVIVINKMDTQENKENCDSLIHTLQEFAHSLGQKSLSFIPLSALKGQGIIGENPYGPLSLLEHLSDLDLTVKSLPLRFPVQQILRHENYRGYAGRVASGDLKCGQEVRIWPGGLSTKISKVTLGKDSLSEAQTGDAVALSFEPEVDISRGYIISDGLLKSSHHWQALIAWMDPSPWKASQHYLLRHTTQALNSYITRVESRLNTETLVHEPSQSLGFNELARVQLKTMAPLWAENYKENMAMGHFILIDPYTSQTVAAGLIEKEAPPHQRETNQSEAKVYWLTGLSGAGKSTLAEAWVSHLKKSERQAVLLDGDMMRRNLSRDLGFTPEERKENLRRAAAMAQILQAQGFDVVCSFISPYRQDRATIRKMFSEGTFTEVFVNCPIEVCQKRDPKGLYAKVARGEIKNFTGIDAPYEVPENPELIIDTASLSPSEGIERLKTYFNRQHPRLNRSI